MLSGYIEGWAGKTVRGRKLGGQEKGEEQLSFACTADEEESAGFMKIGD